MICDDHHQLHFSGVSPILLYLSSLDTDSLRHTKQLLDPQGALLVYVRVQLAVVGLRHPAAGLSLNLGLCLVHLRGVLRLHASHRVAMLHHDQEFGE